MSKIGLILILSFFIAQIFLQSFPIQYTVVVDGDVLCTCGCGHSVTVCAQNHGTSHSNCKCQHDKDNEKRIAFPPNKIDNFIFISNIELFSMFNSEQYSNIEELFIDQYVFDISVPPPKLL